LGDLCPLRGPGDLAVYPPGGDPLEPPVRASLAGRRGIEVISPNLAGGDPLEPPVRASLAGRRGSGPSREILLGRPPGIPGAGFACGLWGDRGLLARFCRGRPSGTRMRAFVAGCVVLWRPCPLARAGMVSFYILQGGDLLESPVRASLAGRR
jgi:hypothetical protein